MIYRRRPSPLHSARAAVGSAYCVAAACVALASEHPLVLAAVLVAVLGAARVAGVGREVRRAALWALPLAALIALANPLVAREGVTVIARGGSVPVLGGLDITLEATLYGGVLGLRALVVIVCFALHSAAVDPDDLLRAFRRLGLRSALTAALATRLAPVLARDARRLHDAQRARAGAPAPAWTVARAVATGALDRAVDVAATLEVRGYGTARRPARARRPWSRHDLAFLAAALALVALAVVAAVSGVAAFEPYPRTAMAGGAGTWALAGALVAVALAPFAQRRGIISC